MTEIKRALLALMVALMAAVSAAADDLEFFLKKGVVYDKTVVIPSAILGHKIGEQPIRHDMMVRYIETVANASDRMKVEVIGFSHEKRPILFITITSPENHAKLDEIRENHLLRSDPATAAQASDDLPVVTWLNYGVHGAESSGMDAVVPTIYHLAAATGDEIERQLDESVILITAIFNPDGHARRASWQTGYNSDVWTLDPADEVHNQIWPGGRTNHYWFDLNRQWLLQTQPESQAWLQEWHKWKPHVSGDFHEMGANSTYYFHPGVPTRKYPLIPARGRELAVEIAKFHAAYMDGAGKLYFSEEGFDNFYIGKGSTYPQVNGGVGFLFEAGAQMAMARESSQGIKTLSNNILIQFNTSLTTIEGARALRKELHEYQRNYYSAVPSMARKEAVKAYVFNAPEDPQRVNMFLDLLSRHKIKVYNLGKDVNADGTTFKASESYIVPMNQAQYRMVKALFMTLTEFPDKVFYDVSAWTMPLMYGLDSGGISKGYSTSMLGAPVIASFEAASEPDLAPYAYVFDWGTYNAPRALNRLLEAGVFARSAMDEMTVQTTKGNVDFGRGAIIVGRDYQTVSDEDIHAIMKVIALEDGITVHAATSGHTLKGGELGGRDSVKDLAPVKAIMVVGSGVSAYDAGEVWHMLDKRMKMNLTLVRGERVGRINWSRYTHLIMVGGSRFNEATTTKIKDWLRDGGTIVASETGAVWVQDTFLDSHKAQDKKEEVEKPRLDYAVKGQRDAEHVIGGTLLGGNLDITHPIGFGYVRDDIAVLRAGTHILKRADDFYANVAVYHDNPVLSGYASPKRQKELGGTPMVIAQRVGSGSVVLFADNPNFRGSMLGNSKMFMNAIFLSKSFSSARRDDEEVDMHHHEE